MEMPPLYMKLWIWMLMQASFKNHGNLERGQFFTSLENMRQAMAHKVGYREVLPTKKQIRGVTKFLTKGRMMVSMKVIHGQVVTILNYNHYQTMKNYEGHDEGHNAGHIQGTILRKKVLKNVLLSEEPLDFLSLKKRYDQFLLENCFKAIRTTRKNGKVADSVLLAQLKKWERYPVKQVEGAIRIYLERDYASQGKREEYLLGIIRGQNKQPETTKPGPERFDPAELKRDE